MNVDGDFGMAQYALFPNPLNHENTVQLTGLTGNETRIDLHSSTGAFVQSWAQPNHRGTLSLPIEPIETGLYIISIHSAHGVVSQRLIKS